MFLACLTCLWDFRRVAKAALILLCKEKKGWGGGGGYFRCHSPFWIYSEKKTRNTISFAWQTVPPKRPSCFQFVCSQCSWPMYPAFENVLYTFINIRIFCSLIFYGALWQSGASHKGAGWGGSSLRIVCANSDRNKNDRVGRVLPGQGNVGGNG